jgi:cold shock CspA family protein
MPAFSMILTDTTHRFVTVPTVPGPEREGTIVTLPREKDYGFIRPSVSQEGQGDIFFHFNDLAGVKGSDLKVQTLVSYREYLKKDGKGLSPSRATLQFIKEPTNRLWRSFLFFKHLKATAQLDPRLLWRLP